TSMPLAGTCRHFTPEFVESFRYRSRSRTQVRRACAGSCEARENTRKHIIVQSFGRGCADHEARLIHDILAASCRWNFHHTRSPTNWNISKWTVLSDRWLSAFRKTAVGYLF